MRVSWKTVDNHLETKKDDKTYKIVKSSGGTVWELFRVVQRDTQGFPSAMTQHYLTNAKSLAAAKKIISDLLNDRVFLDENCIPRRIEDTKKV